MDRPSMCGSYSTTPRAAKLARLLGAFRSGSVLVTSDELSAIRNLYGFKPEASGEIGEFMQAGADRNVMRNAETDGLRLLAWIAKFIPAGEDPLKALVQLASEAGWDVDPSDVAWSKEEPTT